MEAGKSDGKQTGISISTKQVPWVPVITSDAVITDCAVTLFGQPIVENVIRGKLVEAIVNLALAGHGWHQQDAWAGCDFRHDNGTSLEVKQAASRQSWDKTRTIDRKIGFDIAARTGHYDATGWVPFEQRQRLADVYVFAYHPITDDTADHRDPSQWEFYVVPTSRLPAFKRLSLARTRQLADPVSIEGLPQAVSTVTRGSGAE